MVSKKPADHLDAPAFIVGCYTVLKQFHADNINYFLAFLGQYVRSNVDALSRYRFSVAFV